MLPTERIIGRRQSIPIIYVRGTHYEVGFDVGRTFGSLIKNLLKTSTSLNEEFLPAYYTPQGRKAYDDTLNSVKENFPQYVDELQGTADGAKVPFHLLFLLHMDNITLAGFNNNNETQKEPIGCTTICINEEKQQIIGHTEDALSEILTNFYFVSAHIIYDKPYGRWKIKEERFTSLCYAGHLPGYTMNYNHHGLIFSINTLSAEKLRPGKTPRYFLTRALLAAKNFVQAKEILKDSGIGAGDGCSLNMTFLKQEGNRVFHNIEMGPADTEDESQLNVLTANTGEHLFHCNIYLRLPIVNVNPHMTESSIQRMKTLQSYKTPKTKDDVITMLSDQTNKNFPVFNDAGPIRTLAVGIFDCIEKTWTLYSDNPKKNEPLVVLPLHLKRNCN